MAVPGDHVQGLALLVLDVQEGFLKAIPARESLVRRCRFAIAAAHLLGIPTAFTEQVPAKLGATLPDLLSAGPEAVIFPKETFSALGAPGLEDWIDARRIRHLLVIGIETTICVYQTVLDALDKQIAVTLLSDAIGARREEDANAVIQFLRTRTDVSILPSETLFYALTASATHPRFREYTQLVKEAAQ